MFIVMPTEITGIKTLISTLNESMLSDYFDKLHSRSLATVAIPKFQLKDRHDLHEILPSMGMDLPFSDRANLSYIANAEIKISKSVHEAVIIVDEEGSQAAGASFSETVLRMSLPMPPETFICDRPFLFFLRDTETGVNLFAGIMNKMPDASSGEVETMQTTLASSDDVTTTEPAPV